MGMESGSLHTYAVKIRESRFYPAGFVCHGPSTAGGSTGTADDSLGIPRPAMPSHPVESGGKGKARNALQNQTVQTRCRLGG